VRGPDFFIVGAGKCGTTSLHEYLGAHPRIFMPAVKEPRYFADDMPGLMNRISTLAAYEALFAGADDRHLAVGEASPQYLYSRTAIARIREYRSDARLIVMLRNPVDIAQAAHQECLYWFVERERDFERAWRLQPLRRRGERVPSSCSQVTVLLWEDMARLGRQVERLLGNFPRAQVKFVLTEDFARHTRQVYEEVLEFLGVPTDGRPDFPRHNEGKRHRIGPLGRYLVNPPGALAPLRRSALRTPVVGAAWRFLQKINTAPCRRPALRPEFRRELTDFFRDDVRLLAGLIDRDLDHWLR
jgi:hypothetical protein